MNDDVRFQTVNDLKAYADRIPDKAFLSYGFVSRSYDGFLNCEFSFIEDEALLSIYAVKQKGSRRIIDGILLTFLGFLLSLICAMTFFSPSPGLLGDYLGILLVFPLAAFVAAICFIALGRRHYRRHKSLLNGYLNKRAI